MLTLIWYLVVLFLLSGDEEDVLCDWVDSEGEDGTEVRALARQPVTVLAPQAAR